MWYTRHLDILLFLQAPPVPGSVQPGSVTAQGGERFSAPTIGWMGYDRGTQPSAYKCKIHRPRAMIWRTLVTNLFLRIFSASVRTATATVSLLNCHVDALFLRVLVVIHREAWFLSPPLQCVSSNRAKAFPRAAQVTLMRSASTNSPRPTR